MIAAGDTVRVCCAKPQNRVVEAARRALEQNAYFRGRTQLIQMDEQKGVLCLRGRLPTFYLKQVLQTVLRNVEGVEQIDNRVDVD